MLISPEEPIVNSIEKNDASPTTPNKTKQPYETPILSRYGDIHKATQHTPKLLGRGDGGLLPVKTRP